MPEKPSEPFVPAKKKILELTFRSIFLGILLALIMCWANTYLGLYAGMTVSASIPAAVISMGLLRWILRRGTILENNIVQTIASAGESLAAGIIFTVPAMVIAGVWTDFAYWPTVLIALCGGILGIVFMIPLRRTLIVEEEELVYPEGVACAEVLEAGERGGSGIRHIFGALALGAIFKFFVSGIGIIKETVEGAVRAGKSALYFGSDMSVALLGVGYIVGFNVSLLVFLGGAMAWLIGIPIYGIVHGLPLDDPLKSCWNIWDGHIRYMGVGAMVIGGLWSIFKVRSGIVKGIRGAWHGYRGGEETESAERTDRDMPIQMILLFIALTAIPIVFLYIFLTGSPSIGTLATVLMVIAAFFFVAVSSYIVGLVGSSNNPVSGMTICTVLFAAAVLLIFGMRGNAGIIATLGIAGVVCCAACTAGDVSQDLKTGYIVGATPWKQQLAQILGVLFPAFIIPPILIVLHKGYGIGTGAPGSLKAPQATLFASIAKTIFTGKALPWTMVGVGAGIGFVLIVVDEILRARKSSFRAYVMPVAVGIYLPLSLSVPILLGGVIAGIVKALARRTGAEAEDRAFHRGVLWCSGLIAGEAVMGIFIGFLKYTGAEVPTSVLSLFLFVGMVAILVWVAIRGRD
jgi:putative OPT family oligopeptide transporter